MIIYDHRLIQIFWYTSCTELPVRIISTKVVPVDCQRCEWSDRSGVVCDPVRRNQWKETWKKPMMKIKENESGRIYWGDTCSQQIIFGGRPFQTTAKGAFSFRTPHAIWSSAENFGIRRQILAQLVKFLVCLSLKREQDYELVITMEAIRLIPLWWNRLQRSLWRGRWPWVTAEGRLPFYLSRSSIRYEVRLLEITEFRVYLPLLHD